MDDYYTTTAYSQVAKQGGHVVVPITTKPAWYFQWFGGLYVADFVDYIQTIANFELLMEAPCVDYASRMLEKIRSTWRLLMAGLWMQILQPKLQEWPSRMYYASRCCYGFTGQSNESNCLAIMQ